MKWKLEKLGKAFHFIRNGASIKQEDGKSGIPITRIETIANGEVDETKFGYADVDNDQYSDYYLQENDILMSHINSWIHLGKCALVPKQERPIIHGMNLLLMRPNLEILDARYVKHYFTTNDFKSQLHKISNQSVNQSSFAVTKLKELPIPLPPLATQQKIAAILDEADALRRKDKALLAKYDELLQAVFYDMFGDPVKNEKGWEVKRLGNLMKFLTSGSRGWAKYYSDIGELFLRINNVGKNNLQLEEVIYVDAPIGAEGQRTKVEHGDVLLSITADLGRTAVIPRNFPNAYINQHLALIRLVDKRNAFYISQYIASEGGRLQLLKSNKGGVKAGLNFDDIRSLEIPLPPTSLQNKFEIIAQNIQHQKSQITQQQAHSEQLFQSLMQRAFKGELVG